MPTSTGKDPDHSKKSKVFFVAGFSFLMLMAFLSSIDRSIVYILLGISSFFFFLGFYTANKSKPYSQRPRETFNGRQSGAWSFTEIITSIINQMRARSGRSGSPATKLPKIVLWAVLMFIFLFVFVPILTALFSSDGTSMDTTDYNRIGEQYYVEQSYDSSMFYYRQALASDSENTEAMIGYGKVLFAKDAYDSALFYFDKVLAQDNSNTVAAYNKGLIYYNQRKFKEGIELLSGTVDTSPDYYDGMLLLADFYYADKNFDGALPWYEKAYQEGGIRSRMLCHLMAYIYDTKSETERAIPLYQEALSYDSTVVEIYQRLGELLPGQEGNVYRIKAASLR